MFLLKRLNWEASALSLGEFTAKPHLEQHSTVWRCRNLELRRFSAMGFFFPSPAEIRQCWHKAADRPGASCVGSMWNSPGTELGFAPSPRADPSSHSGSCTGRAEHGEQMPGAALQWHLRIPGREGLDPPSGIVYVQLCPDKSSLCCWGCRENDASIYG